MKQRNRLLAGIMCLLIVVICAIGLVACGQCDHTYGEWTVKTQATCTVDGVKERVCTKCDDVETGTIDALGHSYTVESAVSGALKTPATCTTAAVYYKSCSCGAISTSNADTFTSGTAIAHTYNQSTVKAEALKAPATCTSLAVYYKSCTCGAISTSDTDTFTSGNMLSHVYDNEDVKATALKTAATCTSPAIYYKSCDCGAISTSEADTFTSGTAIAHTFDQEVVKTETLKASATCTSPAIYYKSCTCGAISTSNVDTFTSGTVIAHTYDQEIANSDTFVSNATCTSPAIYYKSCDCGAISDTYTFTSGSVIPHNPQLVSSTPATCTEPATETYACSCGTYQYTNNVGNELGHDIDGVTPTARLVSGCEYVYVYICQRSECGEEVEGAHYFEHKHVARITTVATCLNAGEKTLTCSCGDTKYEVIPVDETGHVWVKGGVEDGVRTDECDICGETKEVTVYESNVTASTNANDFKDTEIELKVDTETNANIKLDDGVIDSIGNKNVTVSAGKLSETDINDLGIDGTKLAQVGNNPIYDFKITDVSNGNAISQFGKDNFVTITLPYVLSADEDVNSIAVWFISDQCEDEDCDEVDCEDSAHRLVSIKATYNNGFITFKTNHFSVYTVTRLTAEERCKLYGHNYDEHKVVGNCLKDSYSLFVCVRCHDKYEANRIVAQGHNYQVVDEADATCETNGYVKYECMNEGCHNQYTVTVDALGHGWYVVNDTPASCTANGHVEYACTNCDDTYSVYTDKLPHDYDEVVVDPTCEEDGYTEYECGDCGHSYTGDWVAPLGHSYVVNNWGWAVDYSTASVTLVCENDQDHVVHLNANIVKTIINGTCSNFVKTVYTAKVSYDGTIYEDEIFTEVGNPNHVFGTTLKYDDDEHWYECICGEKNEVEEHVFENAEVTLEPTCVDDGEKTSYCVCGKTHVEIISKTGEHDFVNGECSVCGEPQTDNYYVNLVNSWKEFDGITIKIRDFSVDVDSKYGQGGYIKQVDVAELSLYVVDGEICGGARGAVEVFMEYQNTTTTYDMEAVISDGAIYVMIKDGDGNLNTAIVQSLDQVYDMMDTQSSNNLMGGSVAKFATDTILPTINTLVETHADGLNDILDSLFNILFTFEADEDGNMVATLDFDKLYALNENLANKTIAELIDTYFGEGSFDNLVNFAKRILNLKFSEIPGFINEIGLDYDTLVAQLDEFMASMSPNSATNMSIDAMLKDEQMAEVTLGMMLFNSQDDSYLTTFDEYYVSMLRQNTVYGMFGDVQKIKSNVEGILDMAVGKIGVTFETDVDGILTALRLSADEFSVVSEYVTVEVTAQIDILTKEKIDVTWTDIVDEIENMIAMPPVEMQEGVSMDYGYASGAIEIGGETYFYDNAPYMSYIKVNYDEMQTISIFPDCGAWLNYQVAFEASGYSFVQAQIEIDGVTDMYLIDIDSGEWAKVLQFAQDSATVVYADGSEKTINQPTDPTAESMLEMYLSVFENSKGVALNGYDHTYYYYNSTLNQYETSSQHDYEVTYTMEGDDCNDGVIITYTCSICGDAYTDNVDWHYDFIEEEIDLTQYGSVCQTKAIISKCACGEYTTVNIEQDVYACDFERREIECWVTDVITGYQINIDGSGNWFENNAVILTCAVTEPQCAFNIRCASYWKKDADTCLAYRYETWQFGYDEETGECEYELTFKTGDQSTYHNFSYTNVDNCEKYECADCGSYYQVTRTYDEHGQHIKTEEKGESTIDDGNFKTYVDITEYTNSDIDSVGMYTSREYERYTYFDGDEYWSERTTTYQPYVGTFGEDGYKRTYTYRNIDGENNRQEEACVFIHKNYENHSYTNSYRIYEYYEYESGWWYRNDYTYDFSGKCSVTIRYTDGDGANSVYTEDCCRYKDEETGIPATCTQDGLIYKECSVCLNQSEGYTVGANGHNWAYANDGWYYCIECGLENVNGASGSIVMEDLTDTYGNGTNYVVGYYDQYGHVEFTYYVCIVLSDGEEIIVGDISVLPVDGLRAYSFSKADVEAYAEANGYTDYLVKFVFVPYDDSGSLDYAVTFSESNYDSVISSSVAFVDFIGEEGKDYVIAPTEDAVWVFTALGESHDNYVTLYDENGNEIASDDDNGDGVNFRLEYSLEAGKTYTVHVRWYGDSQVGNMAINFYPTLDNQLETIM